MTTIKGINITLLSANEHSSVCAFVQKNTWGLLYHLCLCRRWNKKNKKWKKLLFDYKIVKFLIATAILLKLRRPLEINCYVKQILSKVKVNFIEMEMQFQTKTRKINLMKVSFTGKEIFLFYLVGSLERDFQ